MLKLILSSQALHEHELDNLQLHVHFTSAVMEILILSHNERLASYPDVPTFFSLTSEKKSWDGWVRG